MRRVVVLGLVVLAMAASLPVGAQDPIVESARKEGRFTWYTSMNIDDSQPLLDAFRKKYPFIKPELWRGSSEKVLNKIQTETRAGKFFFDVVAVNAFEAGFIKANKLAQPYLPPSAKAYRKGFVDPEGYWVDIYDNYFVLGYNTKLVAKAEAPKSWDDLLDPKWKGKFAMDPEDHPWYLALQDAWGREKAEKYGRALAGQTIQWRKGHTLIAQLLTAGEFPLGLVYAHRIEELKQKGAPVEWVTTTDPIPAELHPILIAAKAQNVNAAKLFVEFIASREGQAMIKAFGRIPAHPELELGWSVNPKQLKLQGVGVVGPDRASQVIKDWRDIFRPTGL
ncbi:MAG TPA: extracellular solute-binding protein [Methylomirabilota bacterium]|jgi:iron(III) transport system substrate-binding protein|nr:extracellular solute-binding protein [Methylomirabilota bacterium]